MAAPTTTTTTSNRRGGGARNMTRRTNTRPGQSAAKAPTAVSATTVEAPPPSVTKSATQPSEEDGSEEDDTCWICAQPVQFYSLASCNHRTCHVCALRLRALYKNHECAFCKTSQPSVIFTHSPDRLFEVYTPDMIPFTDEKLRISFETSEMMEDTLQLLRFNCPRTDCDFQAAGWNELKWHTRDAHGEVMCDVCIRHKKIFAHEHTLYTPKLLLLHLPSLRRAPQLAPHHEANRKDKGKEEVPDMVHPICTFCRDCFFGDDELFTHLRERHEECFVCKRLGERDVYFQNYEKLDQHFHNAHFPCTHPRCLEQKFVVFPTQIDLQAHQVEVHGEALSGKQKNKMRVVEAGFAFEEVRTGRGGGPRGRSGALGHPGFGSTTTDGAGGGGRRAFFGGHLTNSSNANEGSGTNEPANDVEYDTSDLAPLRPLLTPLPTSAQFTLISSVRSFRASETSARDMLGNVFRSIYHDHEGNANLDGMAGFVAKVIDVLEEGYKSEFGVAMGENGSGKAKGAPKSRWEEKKEEVLAAWNGIKIEQRESFPSLAPIASSSQNRVPAGASNGGVQAGSAYAGIASGRLINIKTNAVPAPSNRRRTPGSRSVWDRVEMIATRAPLRPAAGAKASQTRTVPGSQGPAPNIASASSSSAFPSLASAASGSSTPQPRQKAASARSAAWGGATPTLSSNPPPVVVPFSVPASSSSRSGPPPPATSSTKQFPGLPPSASNRAAVPKAFVSGNASLKKIRGEEAAATRKNANVWGTKPGDDVGGPASASAETNLGGNEGGSAEGGKGKKKKGKEKLFTLGSFPN